jgi:lipooligosaccharide transport system permease protein
MVRRTIEEYRVTPVTVYDIVLGKIFSGFTQGAIKGAVVFLVILILTPFRIDLNHLPAYILCLALASMMFSCLGTICGTVIDKPENLGRIQSVVIVPLIFMAGIFFPLSSYPAAVLPVIRLLPTTAVFEGARNALLQGSVPAEYLIDLVLSAALCFGLAVYTFNRKMAE